MLNYALKRGKDSDRIQAALTYCKMLVAPQGNGCDPHPISVEDFEKLLTATTGDGKARRKDDPKWRAILLISLNCAFYPVDVCSLTKDAIDLDKGFLRNARTKTRVPRIAVLWKRTIDAIREYQTKDPHSSQYVFVSATGYQYAPNHIGRNFRKLRCKAGVSDEVDFTHIRDGAQTAAIEGGADVIHTDMLLGHRTGIRDDYLKRKPSMVANVCNAIERYYFPEQGDQVKT